jgi:hypothetical protein
MAKLIEQPEQFKAELKDKWLDYYEANRNWLQPLMDKNSNWSKNIHYYDQEVLKSLGYSDYDPCRPESLFILGVITNLEPQLKGLFAFISMNPEETLSIIGLNFDPEVELKKREQQKAQQQTQINSQYLDQIREEIKT